MTELLTAAQMRAIEQAAIDSGEVTGLELMERAGQGVVDAILEWRPALSHSPHHVAILCGPGNNGGDGFVIARLLHRRGWQVDTYLYGDEAKLPPDAAENARRFHDLGPIEPLSSFRSQKKWRHHLVIDALFGTGLTRPIDQTIAQNELWELDDAVGSLNPAGEMRELGADRFQPLVVAVDIPSGVCADSGRVIGGHPDGGRGAVMAHLTVTFHRPKPGHYLNGSGRHEGASRSGKLIVRSIGLEGTAPTQSLHLTAAPRDRLAKGAVSLASNHKYDYGHALILSGGVGKGGAARLAARGALRIGAGLVTVGCPPAAVIENACRLDAIMLRPVAGVEGARGILEDQRINALCLGPGFGAGAACREMTRAVLAESSRRSPAMTGTERDAGLSVVLDADALTSFSDDPAALFAQLNDRCVLTPHEGEFRRLFPDILDRLKEPATRGPAYSKFDATRAAAARAGCVVLFKGADTVMAAPCGRCAINSAHYARAAPWLATAGSGDVLAGFVTGLLARGLAPFDAAETAAWIHVECALKFGPGLIAEDLPEQLPAVFRDFGL